MNNTPKTQAINRSKTNKKNDKKCKNPITTTLSGKKNRGKVTNFRR